ncbi:uncharacterized protein LOC114881266 [Osmia bicornis bicornis]|uniref:uncharacterized protein LOC114881266 n=1 Tax=Osmia bicornis bicornis TaxID=1437191 RepID=UPI0010F6F140|nr:uncharacterized protein LOC114881266 [Osmia bicornis bicornis]
MLIVNTQNEIDNFGKQLMSGDSGGKSVKPKVAQRSEARTAHVVATAIKCTLCGGSHHLYGCAEFLKLPVEGRISEVQKRALCFNCLKSNHRNKHCTFGPCKRCSRKHNTLLHKEDPRQLKTTITDPVKEQGQAKDQATVSMHSSLAAVPEVLLSTVLVQVVDARGRRHPCRVLLDSCFQSNFITQNLCNQAQLTLSPIDTVVNELGQLGTKFKYRTTATVESRFERYEATISCLVIPKITEDMPNIPLDITQLKIPKNIVLADPQYDRPGPIDMLIGGELFWQLLSVGQIKLLGEQRAVVLQKTRLGWVMAGPMAVPLNQENRQKARTCHLITTSDLQMQLTKFWEIEDWSASKGLNPIDKEDVCEKHFIETTARDESGRFIVSIPFKDNVKNLGDSEDVAL